MIEKDNGISEYFRQELVRRVTKRTVMLERSEEGREKVRAMERGGVVLNRLMITGEVSKLDLAKELRVGVDFITFLRSGLVFHDELTVSMRRKIAKMFDLDPDIIHVVFGFEPEKKRK